MRRGRVFWSAAVAVILIVLGSMARADIPAQDIEYADIEALHVLVVEYFGPCQAAQLRTSLENASTRSCPRATEPTKQRCLGVQHELHRGLARLIADAGKVKQDGLDEFLTRLNDAGILRGQLIAREGGDYVPRLGIEVDDGRRFLISRHVFRDGRVSTWRLPLPGR